MTIFITANENVYIRNNLKMNLIFCLVPYVNNHETHKKAYIEFFKCNTLQSLLITNKRGFYIFIQFINNRQISETSKQPDLINM